MMVRATLLSLFLIIDTYVLLFLIASINEKEKRAAFFSFIFILLSLVFLLSTFPVWLYWAITTIILLFCALLFIPFGKRSRIEIIGLKSRYDERDIMFARANYEQGSFQYSDYYAKHPEKKKVDDRVRAMPELLSPGGECYEPIDAACAACNFALTEKLIPLCDGEPGSPMQINPAALTKKLKEMTMSLGAVDVGVAQLDAAHVYSHVGRRLPEYGTPIHLNHSHILVFAVEMDYETMQGAPQMPVVVESSKKYLQSATIAVALASCIRSFGYNARAHIDGNYLLPLPAAAVDAGLGEIGRIGYLIHPTYGARIRLAAVSTDMPISVDQPIAFGVQDFCRICKKCAEFCPSGAISHGEEKTVRGVRKWSTHQEVCYRYWRTVGTDCGICMRVCPYSKPANFAHNFIRFMIRQNPVGRRVAVWGDKLLYD